MKQKLFILLCLTVFCLSAQNKNNELNIGIGQILYKNSAIMPSGVSGIQYELDYWHKHSLKSNNRVSFGYFADLDFANLNSWKTYNYQIFESGLDAGVFWLGNLPVKNEKINLYAGGGLLFDSDIYYSSYYSYDVYGQWFLSPFIYFLGDYNLKKFNFRFRFSLPVLSFGFQSKTLFYPTFFENAKLVLTPNAFAFFTKRFHPQADISVSYPVFCNDETESRLQLKYSLEQLVYNGFPGERKAVNGIKLGMVWIVK
jgi:hypothetical protein